jgi:hypothetical protein
LSVEAPQLRETWASPGFAERFDGVLGGVVSAGGGGELVTLKLAVAVFVAVLAVTVVAPE